MKHTLIHQLVCQDRHRESLWILDSLDPYPVIIIGPLLIQVAHFHLT